jgi:hypothetical protein
MGRKHYTPEQIIRLLRQSEVLSSQGRNLPEICREIGVTLITAGGRNTVVCRLIRQNG